jgi:hypothetical protein
MKNKGSVLLVIILVHIFWFAIAMHGKHFYMGDSSEYVYMAENFKKGMFYATNPAMPLSIQHYSLRTPGYPLFLLFSYTLFGEGSLPVFILQNILSIASCWMIFTLFAKVFPQKKYPWIFVLLVAVYPIQFIMANMVLTDNLFQFCIMLYFRQLILNFYRAKTQRIWWMSLWLVLSFFVKPVTYPFLCLHFLYCLWHIRKWKTAQLIIPTLFPLLLVVGYGFWNKHQTGLYHLSSIQPMNMLDYNLKRFQESKFGFAKAQEYNDTAHQVVNRQPDYVARYQKTESLAIAGIRRSLVPYAIFHLRESMRYFIEPGKVEIDVFFGYFSYAKMTLEKGEGFFVRLEKGGLKGGLDYLKDYPLILVIILLLFFNVVRSLGFVIFLFDRSIPVPVRIAIAIYVLYFAVITGPVSYTSRYYLPCMLVTSACAMMAYSGLWQKRKAGKLQHT